VRHILFWRYFGLGFSGIVCLVLGGIVSEFVQSLLPVSQRQVHRYRKSDFNSSTRLSNGETLSYVRSHLSYILKADIVLGKSTRSISGSPSSVSTRKVLSFPSRSSAIVSTARRIRRGRRVGGGTITHPQRVENCETRTNFKPIEKGSSVG
jgi:hypothetical protein